MSEELNFRTAINGFNRKDVVRYIEFLNNKHTAQLNQIRTETDELRAELALARQAPARSMRLEAELAATKKRCADLEAALAAVSSQLDQPAPVSAPAPEVVAVPAPVVEAITEPVVVPVPAPVSESRMLEELEAYRRAERAERKANERAREICDQANGVLADATARVDDTAAQFAEMAEQIAEQLNLFRELVIGSKATLKDAATAMYAIRPEEDDD